MLYKNLPEKELNKVLCVRSFWIGLLLWFSILRRIRRVPKLSFRQGEILSVPVIALLLPAWRI